MNFPVVCRRGLFTLAVSLLTRGSFAYDADTLALYLFREKADGAAVSAGEKIANAAKSAYAGTVVAVGTPVATDTLLYDAADVPGKYVFETNAFGAVAVIANAQSLVWSRADSASTARGLSIDFAGVAKALSALDEWTIELFVAWPSETASLHSYYANMYFNAGATIDGTTAVGTSVNLGVSQSQIHFWNDLPANIWSHYSKTSHWTYLRYGDSCPMDGKWHHVALVYRRSANQYTCYYDYGLCKYSITGIPKCSERTMPCTNLLVSASNPLQLGLGRMVGKVFCPRVTKRALAPEQFLHASNDPEYLPRTVFLLTFDGENCDQPSVFTNVASSATAFGNQFIPNSFNYNKDLNPYQQYPFDWSAHAKVYEASGATEPPALMSCTPHWRGYLTDGKNGSKICMNTTSVLEDCTENQSTNKDYLATAQVPYVSALSYPLVRRGSFTMEGFVKLDYERFKERTHFIDIYERGETAKYGRFTLFGVDLGDGPDFCLSMQYYHPYRKWCLMCVTWEKNDDGTRRYNGSSVWSEQFKGDYNNVLLDDKWHHVAAVYDDTTLKVTVYVDYKVQITGTFKYPYVLQASYHSSFYVGGTIYGHAMPGYYDNFRYSRVALKPEQFLRDIRPTGLYIIGR